MSGSSSRSKLSVFLDGGLAGPELRVTCAIAYAAKAACCRHWALPEPSLSERRSGQ